MQAVTFDLSAGAPGKLRYHDNFPKPNIQNANEVLIEVAYAGVCGTDLHIIASEFPCKSDSPVILGHEFSGRVIQVGPSVTNVKVNDFVAVDPNHGCFVCSDCRHGNVHFCNTGGLNNTIGIYRNGGFAQYALVPDVQVHKLPEVLTLMQGALSEPISCIIHGWEKIQPISVGKRILITGAGIIGNLWLACLQVQGHRNITVSEVNVARLEHVRRHFNCECVTPVVLSARVTSDNVDSLTRFGYDYVIDCSGNGRAIEQGVSLLKPGGVMCIFGVASPETRINLAPYDLFAKELTIMGVKINPFTFPKALGIMESLANDYLIYEKLGIKVFQLADYEVAIDELKRGKIGKAMFQITK